MEFFPSTQDRAATGEFIERQQRCLDAQGCCFFATERLDTGQFVGFIGFKPIRFEAHFTPGIEIGWRLGFEHWGHGYATEGAKTNLSFAFDKLNIERIYSFTSISNKGSENVMKKIGMTYVGEFDHPSLPADHQLGRHVLYELIRP